LPFAELSTAGSQCGGLRKRGAANRKADVLKFVGGEKR
jgi:hypothetical protein